MPTLANIVVKKGDNTTNFTFTALSASPGDGGFAQWRGEGSSPALSSNLRMKTVWNGSKTQRRAEISGSFPKVETLSGVNSVTGFVSFSFTLSMPQNFTVLESGDAVAVIANAIASQLIRDSMATGYAPT